jgi:hypothetical protein
MELAHGLQNAKTAESLSGDEIEKEAGTTQHQTDAVVCVKTVIQSEIKGN